MQSVEKALKTFGDEGNDLTEFYHGLVVNNFECEKDLYVTLEVAAGNSLFQHIVDTDKIATKIQKRINQLKLPGETTMMPLNRLLVPDMDYPLSSVSANTKPCGNLYIIFLNVFV